MSVYKYAISYVMDFILIENGKIYRVFENRRKVEITQEEFAKFAASCQETGQQYKIIHDYEVLFMMDLWDEKPSLIDKEQLDFYFEYGILSEDEYRHYCEIYQAFSRKRDMI